MANRLDLQTSLEQILGSRNVYYQPPESVKMIYPAIVYSLENIEIVDADNSAYTIKKRYQLTLIDKNPDSELVDKIIQLSTCHFDRTYTSENLNHWTFSLYLLTKEDIINV